MLGTSERLMRSMRTLFAGLFGLAVLVGVPLALWRFVGNPMDLLPQSWDEAQRMVQQRNITTDLLLAVLAVVMWILWLQFVWATMWELLVIGPRAGRGEVARDAPGVPHFIRSIVSAVSSGLLSASVVASASSAGSLLPDLVASAPVLAGEVIHGDVMSDEVTASNTMNVQFYRIADHDRMWDLAGQNDAMLQRILEMNADQVKSPIDFRPGMKIRVPASLGLRDAVLDEAELELDSAERDGPSGRSDSVYEVVEGDNLWNISKMRLAEAEGDPPSNHEIADEVSDVVERNPDAIEDPDLIYPGERLTLRSVDDPDGSVDNSDGPVDELDEPVGVNEPDAPAPDERNTDNPTLQSTAVQGPSVRSTTIGSTTIQSTSVLSTTIESVPVDPADESVASTTLADLDNDADPPAGDTTVDEQQGPPVWPGLIGGAALSSALLGLYLAGRRDSNGFSVGFSRKDNAAAEEDTPPLLRAIARSADPRFMTWVARRLDDTLAGHGTSAAFPRAMLVTPGEQLEMQWSEPVVLTAPKWGMVDGEGRRWACDYEPNAESTGSDPPSGPGPAINAALPAMLSLGRVHHPHRDGATGPTELLVNVEHFGSIAVCGSTAHVFPAVRAMIFELASGGQVCRTRVTTVDFEVEGAAILPAIGSARETDALDAAAAPAEAGSTLHVFVVQATDAKLDRWFELAKPGSGVGLILIGDVRSSRLGSRFVLAADGTGEFHGLETRVRVVELDSSAALALEDMFRSAGPGAGGVHDADPSAGHAESFEPAGG